MARELEGTSAHWSFRSCSFSSVEELVPCTYKQANRLTYGVCPFCNCHRCQVMDQSVPLVLSSDRCQKGWVPVVEEKEEWLCRLTVGGPHCTDKKWCVHNRNEGVLFELVWWDITHGRLGMASQEELKYCNKQGEGGEWSLLNVEHFYISFFLFVNNNRYEEVVEK